MEFFDPGVRQIFRAKWLATIRQASTFEPPKEARSDPTRRREKWLMVITLPFLSILSSTRPGTAAGGGHACRWKYILGYLVDDHLIDDSNSNQQEWINISTKANSPAYPWKGILDVKWHETRESKEIKYKFRPLFPVVNMLTNMAACPVVDQHCPCADMTWWNLMNELFELYLGNTKMFTSKKIGRMVFIYFYFDKILTHANAIDRMHVNAR